MRLTKHLAITDRQGYSPIDVEVRNMPGFQAVSIGCTNNAVQFGHDEWEAIREFVDQNLPIGDAYILCGQTIEGAHGCILDADHQHVSNGGLANKHTDKYGFRWSQPLPAF